jgi:anaerobic selenocysteine-containing dehydrogenase
MSELVEAEGLAAPQARGSARAQLPQGARHISSVCPLDCPDACSLDVTVAEGRILEIGGSRVNPLTDGYICAKVRRFGEHVHGEARVLSPGVREGRKGEGRFRRVSWEEALSLVAEKMRALSEAGQGEAILPVSYGGSNGYLSQDTTDARLFSRLKASRLLRTVCAMPTGRAATGLYGAKIPGVAIQDYARAKLIVLWGVNPSVSGIHLVPNVLEAQKRGARLVVVDPRRTRLAERADLHLAVHPGTDLPVALAVIRWLFANGAADLEFLARHATGAEELRRRAEPWTFERAAEVSRVAAEDIERLAQWYAASSPAAIRCGWGVERNRNGGSAVAAILALPAVAGKFGVRGGGYTLSNTGAWDLDSLSTAQEPAAATRAVNMNRLGEELLREERRIRLVFVYNCNPLATLPNQEKVRAGLARDDLFTVVFDPVMTDTARYADVLLPAATFLEREELRRGYGSLALQNAKAVIPPVGESRPNHEVFAELCRRAGVSRQGEPETAAELTEAILARSREGIAIRAALDSKGIAFPGGNPAPVQFVDVFPRTADGKIHLVPEHLDREAPGGLYAYREGNDANYPLALISPATDRTISSMMGELWREQVPLEIHPEDAAPRGIGDGDLVRIHNQYGECRCRARVTAALPIGVVMLPKGLWSHNTVSGTTANALVPDTLTDLGEGACFNDARVEVERLSPPPLGDVRG